MKKLLFIMVAFMTTAAYGQQKVSAKSNAIQLELNGIVPTITWISPQTYETNLTEKQFTVKVGVKSQGKVNPEDLSRPQVPVMTS